MTKTLKSMSCEEKKMTLRDEEGKMLDEMARDTGNGYMLISFGLPVNDDGEDVYIKLSKTCVGVKWNYLLKIITVALCYYARQASFSSWDVVKDVLHTMRMLSKANNKAKR